MLDVTVTKHAIRIGERFAVSFQRTLRIPDDGRTYPLPPGFGTFPIFKVDDYARRVPSDWRAQGGAFIPMYQREALWLGFDAATWKPNAVQIAVGRVNAISGGAYEDNLRADPQNYVVCPDQPWLDGINAGHGSIRQFVAMPLGLGYTVEASLSGSERFGGIQITVFEPKPGRFPDTPPPAAAPAGGPVRHKSPAMGLGAGGVMKQKIYPDSYGLDAWDLETDAGGTVHIVNSERFAEITGSPPPPPPIDAQTYTTHGFPWFDLYDETRGRVPAAENLVGVKTIVERDAERGTAAGEAESFHVPDAQIEKLHPEQGADPHPLRRSESTKRRK